jgi:hypothetical protein
MLAETGVVPQTTQAEGAMGFRLQRMEGDKLMYLYRWNQEGAYWGPDVNLAHSFGSPAKALDLAVLCGGPDNVGQVTVEEE